MGDNLYLMIFGTRNPEKSLCHIFGTILSHFFETRKVRTHIGDRIFSAQSVVLNLGVKFIALNFNKLQEGKPLRFSLKNTNPELNSEP